MTTRFVDIEAPAEMPGYPCISIPRWSTQVVTVASGDEQANQRWAHPLFSFVLPNVARKHVHFAAVRDHWMAMRGPFHTWPFRDPLDFASVELAAANQEPTVSGTDQVIGAGDGTTTTFQLVKTYARGTQTYSRTIVLPILTSLLVTVDGVPMEQDSPALYECSRPGGVITFAAAPAGGAVIRAGFLFDVMVRFEADDSFAGIVKNWQVSGEADITLLETRYCED